MNILILKPDHLGDFVLALPSLWEARQKIPSEARLDILASPSNQQWQEIFPWISEIIPFKHPRYARPRKRFAPFASLSALHTTFRLRQRHYHYAVDLTSARHDLLSKLSLKCAFSKETHGHCGSHDFLLDVAHPFAMAHQTSVLAQRFPEKLNITGQTPPSTFMPQEFQWKPNTSSDILISPWAGTSAKQWPLENWNNLIEALSKNWKVHILIPPDAFHQSKQLIQNPNVQKLYIHTISKTLQQLSACRLVIAVDTATAHFAWLTGTPLVQLFSGTTEPERWGSLASGIRIHHPPQCAPCHLETCNQSIHQCMIQIKEEEILDAVGQLTR